MNYNIAVSDETIVDICQERIINEFFFKIVSHDIDHNTYHWLRPPHIQKNINLDNHEVDIKEYNFTYELEGKLRSNCVSNI